MIEILHEVFIFITGSTKLITLHPISLTNKQINN